jgi:predicted nucleotidyltransferase
MAKFQRKMSEKKRVVDVMLAYVFGSVGREEQNVMSDVDIAVYLEKESDPVDARVRLLGQICRELGTDDIDLVVLNHAPVTLQGRVIRDGEVIVEKTPFYRHALESLVMRKFFDFSIKEKQILEKRFGIG